MDVGTPNGSSADLDLTVVSNLYNEESRIPRLLGMLERQQIPNLRVILVDDGSTDRTREKITSYEGPLDVHLIALDHVGLAPARAEGLAAVHEGVAVVVDADMSIDPGWLAAIGRLFGTDPDIGGSFSRVGSSGDAWIARGGQAAREVVYWVRSRSSRPWMIGHGMAIRSEAYQRLDFSADDLTAEDLEISERLIQAGWRVVALDEPPIRTEDPVTLAGVWSRHFEVGRRTAHLVRRHPRFLFRASSVGRFFPSLLIGAWLIDRRLAVAGEVAMTGVLFWAMHRRNVARSDLGPGWAIFHVQTTASLAGLVLELGDVLQSARGRSTSQAQSSEDKATPRPPERRTTLS